MLVTRDGNNHNNHYENRSKRWLPEMEKIMRIGENAGYQRWK